MDLGLSVMINIKKIRNVIRRIEGIVKNPKFGVIAKKRILSSTNSTAILLIIVTCFIIFFYLRNKLLFTPDFGESDAYHLNLSLKYLLSQSLKNNTIPFWTEALQGGFPIFTESQIGALFLPNLFFLKFFSFTDGFNLLLIFSLFLLTSGMYLLLRQYKIGRLLSLVLAYTFTFGGALSLRWVHLNLIQTYSLFPLLFLVYLKFKESLNKKYFLLFSIILSQMIFAGHFQVVFICLLGLFSYIIGLIFKDNLKAKAKHIFYFFLMVMSGAIISLPQILPTLDLISQSSRQFQMNFSGATSFPFMFKNLISFIFPYHFGDPRIGTYPPFSNNWGIFWENTPYLGIIFFVILLVLLLFTWFYHSKKNIWLIKILITNIIFFTLLVFGKNSPIYLIFEFPPFNLFRTPSKYLLVVHFFLILIMALSIGNIQQFYKKKWLYFSLCFLLLINLFQLIKFTNSYHLFLGKDIVLEKPKIVEFDCKSDYITIGQENLWNEYFIKKGWKDKNSIDNYIFYKNFLYPNSGILFGVNSTSINTGAFKLWRRDYVNNFILSAIKVGEKELTIDTAVTNLLSKYNIGHIVSAYPILSDEIRLKKKVNLDKQNIYLYSLNKINTDPFFIPERLYKISSIDDFNQAYNDKQISKKSAFLEVKNLKFKTNANRSKINVVKNSDYEIVLTGKFDRQVFIVFNKNYYPEWQAYIDGKKTAIVKTDITRIGFFVPQGDHEITLKYENKMFKIGISISVIYLFILSIAFLEKKRIF